MMNDFFLGPYLLPTRLNGSFYRIFLEEILAEVLQDILIIIRNGL